MALRLRRDVQKASYYVWFLGAEEAKGLRGNRVINSVLPYLIDRSRSQEPIKVTLQVSHKGIKIIQGSSKHFIPHSAITSSVQTDDIVACVLLLYNPITKCPLHVHAYRCDSETTAEALNQQLQILINRPENQKRFEELESRLGIIPGMPPSKSSNHDEMIHKKEIHHQQQQQHSRTRHEAPPKRLLSSMGSDTGNSTRESEGSEDINGNSPMSRSPSGLKPLPLQQNNELFDSLAAELRAKLNGNGPPLLLPPRDYDTVHRSKGNLAAIELRRCRNSLIVGSDRPGPNVTQNMSSNIMGGGIGSGGGGGKQVSSRGSSGIGSDLAPSPERQDINSSSEDEHWSNEADNSVIALKPSQISVERTTAAITQHHVNLSRKNAVHPRDDGYLRDLPAKPYTPRTTTTTKNEKIPIVERDSRAKTPASNSWCREDEIKPIIVRPTNYDSKINRVLQSEQQFGLEEKVMRERPKVHEERKGGYLNHVEVPEQRYKSKPTKPVDDYDDGMVAPNNAGHQSYHRKENLTDKQKYMEYSSKSKPLPTKSYAHEEVQRYGGKHRYVDPADLPFEQNTSTGKYDSYHRESHSPDHSELSHRTAERPGAKSRDVRDGGRMRHRSHERQPEQEHHSRDEREHLSHSKERNPYREPESIPYIESMEKMMKSTAIRYKSYDNSADLSAPRSKEPLQNKLSQRSKTHSHHDDDLEYNYNNYPSHGGERGGRGGEFVGSSNKDRFKDAKDKFRSMERSGSRYELADDKDQQEYKSRQRGPSHTPEQSSARVYDDWSDEEHLYDSPPPEFRSRQRSREQWMDHGGGRPTQVLPVDVHGRDGRPREASGKRGDSRNRLDNGDYREQQPTRYREKDHHHRAANEERMHEHTREYVSRRDYTPERTHHRSERSVEAHYPPANGKASPPGSGIGIPSAAHGKGGMPANMTKGGYRHSYAEPVFSRSAGRVGLAAVNPY
ncbi:uncharacterized protein LOC106095381 [Stomoxys calcitrans]|uniref:uncharacterized protein LOC106095381 n=1 Tax=Stomoxys calcitrans TaxID=35570 RepID=UPI0027E2B9D2|nr:uncharacterized protein LOC106095381 [Stomoxys calcitrans]XP_059222600.1 uncharacterized protein LOC106095381 [Stomoxys calcitrans]